MIKNTIAINRVFEGIIIFLHRLSLNLAWNSQSMRHEVLKTQVFDC